AAHSETLSCKGRGYGACCSRGRWIGSSQPCSSTQGGQRRCPMTAQAKPKLALRPFLPADAPLLAEIFRASIAELTGDDYSETQQEAWTATVDDEEAFTKRLASALTLLGTLAGSPVGFASLAGAERVDMH